MKLTALTPEVQERKARTAQPPSVRSPGEASLDTKEEERAFVRPPGIPHKSQQPVVHSKDSVGVSS